MGIPVRRQKTRINVKTDPEYFTLNGDPYHYKFMDANTLQAISANGHNTTVSLDSIRQSNPSFLSDKAFIAAQNKFNNKTVQPLVGPTQPSVITSGSRNGKLRGDSTDVASVVESAVAQIVARTNPSPAPSIGVNSGVNPVSVPQQNNSAGNGNRAWSLHSDAVAKGLIEFGQAIAGGDQAAPGLQVLGKMGLAQAESNMEEEYYRQLMSGKPLQEVNVPGIDQASANRAYSRYLAMQDVKTRNRQLDITDAQGKADIQLKQDALKAEAPERTSRINLSNAQANQVTTLTGLAGKDQELRQQEFEHLKAKDAATLVLEQNKVAIEELRVKGELANSQRMIELQQQQLTLQQLKQDLESGKINASLYNTVERSLSGLYSSRITAEMKRRGVSNEKMAEVRALLQPDQLTGSISFAKVLSAARDYGLGDELMQKYSTAVRLMQEGQTLPDAIIASLDSNTPPQTTGAGTGIPTINTKPASDGSPKSTRVSAKDSTKTTVSNNATSNNSFNSGPIGTVNARAASLASKFANRDQTFDYTELDASGKPYRRYKIKVKGQNKFEVVAAR